MGLPMAVTLIRPDIDQWAPGEHNGTFRGFNPAFVTATAALDYWRTPDCRRQVQIKGEIVSERLQEIAMMRPGAARGGPRARPDAGPGPGRRRAGGRGRAARVRRGLVIETSGPVGPRAQGAAAAHDLGGRAGVRARRDRGAVDAAAPTSGFLRAAA
jgi:diaminobutyrate-2-oxoglutarate transaminase